MHEKWELSNEHLIATLVHPNLKHFRMCPHMRGRAVFLLKEEMIERQENVLQLDHSLLINPASISSSTSSTLNSSPSLSSATTIISSRKNLLMQVFDKPCTNKDKTNIEQEIEHYLKSTTLLQVEENDDILGYWKEHCNFYPLIASIACDVLAISASNTLVERLFSSCKNTVKDKRTKLGHEKLNKLMFLQKNLYPIKRMFDFNSNQAKDCEKAKRKQDITALNQEKSLKKIKSDILIHVQSSDETLVIIQDEIN